MIKFPYGRRDFYELITEDYLYLDRTHHLPFLENWGKELLFMRPRRFGKSLLLSMLENYYDIAKKEEFERLFGHLTIGQNPTPLHNTYIMMKWDFSNIAAQGSIEQIQDALNSYINTQAQILQNKYRDYLRIPIDINKKDAFSTFALLVSSVKLSGYKLYLLIDEYDNFANEVMMSRQNRDQDRYLTLVKGEGMFKTLFKNLKSAGSGDGLDRVFMTGVSPIVLNDVTSGANVFQNGTWHPELNVLCGFTRAEIYQLVQQVIEECQLPDSYVEKMMTQMHNFYNGSLFIDDYRKFSPETRPKVYNPTLSLYFLKAFQETCDYPKQMLDENLMPDDNKLAYIADFAQGEKMLKDALAEEKVISVQTLRQKFGVMDLLNPNLQEDRLAVLLCHLGGLTSVGETFDGQVILEIPNLVMRKLYGARILALMTENNAVKIHAGQSAAGQLFTRGEMQPLCDFIQEQLLMPIFVNRDMKDFNELTVKTLFIMLLYHTDMYLIDSEQEAERRYSDLLMLVRPGMRYRGLTDLLIEFKHIALNKVTEEVEGKRRKLNSEDVKAKSHKELVALDAVKAELDEAKNQLWDYRQKLARKYVKHFQEYPLKLKTYAVVSVGAVRLLWEEIEDRDDLPISSTQTHPQPVH